MKNETDPIKPPSIGLGSVAVKIGAILLALMCLTALAVGLSYMSFKDISAKMDDLTQARLPAVHSSVDMIRSASGLKDEVTGMLLADAPDALNARYAELNGHITQLEASMVGMDTAVRDTLLEEMTAMHAVIDQLREAREREFNDRAAIDAAILDLNRIKTEIRLHLEVLTDDAYFDLAIGAEEAIDTVNASFAQVIDGDVGTIQTLIRARSEFDLLSGIALGLQEDGGMAYAETLNARGRQAVETLTALFVTLDEESGAALDFEALRAALAVLDRAVAGNLPRPVAHEQILSANRTATGIFEQATAKAREDMLASTEVTKDVSAEIIDGLLSVQVTRMRELGELNLAVLTFIGYAHEAAISTDHDALDLKQEKLVHAAAEVEQFFPLAGEDLTAVLREALAIADPESGIVKLRHNVLNDQEWAMAMAEKSAAGVATIARTAEAFGADSLTKIRDHATGIGTAIAGTRTYLVWIAAASAAIFLAALAATHLMLVRPISAAAMATESIAKGRDYPMDSLRGSTGEVGRMADALIVLRKGLEEKAALEAKKREMDAAEARRREEQAKADLQAQKEARKREEQERIAAAAAARKEREEMAERAALKEAAARERQERLAEQAEAERRAEREAHERAEKERAEKAEAERRQREREAREAAEREAMRAEAEAERQKHMEDQAIVVRNLADGLGKLAAGNLDAKINTPFAGAYEELRRDFNTAIERLTEVIGQIAETGDSVATSSADILRMATGSTQRAEKTAAQLEETAAALEELTASVKQTSQSAEDVNIGAQKAKKQASEGSEVVQDTISVMGEIEASSSRIANITGVIDDIAFQTNLLALNAGVEAARAGDAGRGFAVVASEVRSLAQRSSEAAREISQLISESDGNVKRGVDMVGQTGNVISAITGSVETIAGEIDQIVIATREQSLGVSEVNSNLNEIDRATQQNVSSFEETTKEAHEMNVLADSLAESTSNFTLPTQHRRRA